jgi:mono/diheme cytochrome c family protein
MTNSLGPSGGARAGSSRAILIAAAILAGMVVVGGAAWALAPGIADPHAPVVINNTAVAPLPTLGVQNVESGSVLFAQYCAACHGAELQGAANWKVRLSNGSLPPPPHDDSGHTWHHPDPVLLSIVTNGGDPAYNGVMPGFAETLTDDQMAAILDFIKSQWSREHREYPWWMTVTTQGKQP